MQNLPLWIVLDETIDSVIAVLYDQSIWPDDDVYLAYQGSIAYMRELMEDMQDELEN